MPPVIQIAKSGAKHAPTLPADAVTRTFGIFGMKDSGKTTAARVLVEGVCRIGGHAVVIDPVGVWWGATRAGSGPGIKGVVIGGEHGDVPLEETGGKLVADLVLSRQYPLVVIDTSMLRKAARERFLADFLEELYFRNRRPLMVIFEEADQSLPQAPRQMNPTLGRVLGAAEDIVKLGRSRGLGAALISQRFATVNKNVTEQIESLLLLRIIGPNDRKAVKGWIESNGEAAVTGEVLDSMASLHQGEGWLYSPGWLRLLERVRLRAARTLDSSATPTEEEAVEQNAAKRASVSLDDLRTQMAATIERARENDPAELRKVVKELRADLEKARASVAEPAAPEKIIVPDAELVSELRDVVEVAQTAVEELRVERAAADETVRAWKAEADGAMDALGKRLADAEIVLRDSREQLTLVAGLPPAGRPAAPKPAVRERPTPRAAPAAPRPREAGDAIGRVSGPQQKLLDTLAWFASIGVDAPRKPPLAAMAGVSSKSSGYRANLSALSSAGLIHYPGDGRVALSADGEQQAVAPERPGTEQELQEGIIRMVSGPQAAILRELIAAYPEGVEREALALSVGVSPASSGYRANLSTLRGLELMEYPQTGYCAAADLLFIR